MWASVLLYVLVKKYRWIGLAAGGVSCVAVVVTALDLARHFPRVVSTYDEVGLTPMSLVLRHYGFMLVPLLMLLGFLFAQKAEYALLRPEKKKAKKKGVPERKTLLRGKSVAIFWTGSGTPGSKSRRKTGGDSRRIPRLPHSNAGSQPMPKLLAKASRSSIRNKSLLHFPGQTA